jgi:hypothetical protein
MGSGGIRTKSESRYTKIGRNKMYNAIKEQPLHIRRVSDCYTSLKSKHNVISKHLSNQGLRSQGARVEFESEKHNLDTRIICAEGWGRISELKPFKSS